VATWGPIPDLSSWIRHRDGAVTFVLALVDHEGGNVAVYDSQVPEAEQEESVGGEEQFVHKVPVGGWSALRYQHTTENVAVTPSAMLGGVPVAALLRWDQ
jgi:hypothetical protein